MYFFSHFDYQLIERGRTIKRETNKRQSYQSWICATKSILPISFFYEVLAHRFCSSLTANVNSTNYASALKAPMIGGWRSGIIAIMLKTQMIPQNLLSDHTIEFPYVNNQSI